MAKLAIFGLMKAYLGKVWQKHAKTNDTPTKARFCTTSFIHYLHVKSAGFKTAIIVCSK
jgi:hypothetical protein